MPRPAGSATLRPRCRATCCGVATTCASSFRCTRSLDLQGCEQRPVAALQGLSVRVGTNEYRYDVQEARLPGSDLWVQLVDCPAVFDRPFIYSDAHDEHVRYLMLTRAALECCQRLGFAPDIVHCNDWHTAFAPLLLRTAYAWDTQIFGATRSVFTIHNIGYQGVFSASAAADVGPGVEHRGPAPGRPRPRPHQPDAARHPLRGRGHDGQPDVRQGDPHARGRLRPRRATCARAATRSAAS